MTLVGLPVFGRRARLVWRKRRWRRPDWRCPARSGTEQSPAVAAPRPDLTYRAGRWATFQVGAHGRTVSEVAADLGCDWHTVNDAVVAYGRQLVDDPDPAWRAAITDATLDLSGPYRCVFDTMLVIAKERLDDHGEHKLVGLLRAGDRDGQVATAWHAKDAVRELYAHTDARLAFEWVDVLSESMRDEDSPAEIRQLGRALRRWR